MIYRRLKKRLLGTCCDGRKGKGKVLPRLYEGTDWKLPTSNEARHDFCTCHSLDRVTSGFRDGIVTKGEYEWSLRAYHNRQLAMKSEARDKAAAVVHLMRPGE